MIHLTVTNKQNEYLCWWISKWIAKCGKCKTGILTPDSKKCKICKSKVNIYTCEFKGS